jgi:hypothetical protein
MPSPLQLLSYAAMIVSVMAAPPAVKDAYFTTVQFESEQLIDIMVIKMDFDQDVFMKRSMTGSVTAMPNLLNVTRGEYPDLVWNGIGIANVTCGNPIAPHNNVMIRNTFLEDDGSQPDGPPRGYLTAPPTTDPASSLLNILFKGVRLNETFVPNRYALVFPLSPNLRRDALQRMNCTVAFNSNAQHSISNRAGEVVSGSIPLKFQPPRCDLKEVEAMIEAGTTVMQLGSDINNGEQLSSFVNLINSITAREAFAGCRGLVSSWMTFRNATMTATGNQMCLFRFDQPEWRTDPCCNHELLQTQCCRPRSVTFQARVVDSFNTTRIAATCKNPTQISSLLTNVVDAMKGESQEPLDFNKMFQTFTQFVMTCSEAVFNQQCTTDADCPYSGSCGQNGQCLVDFTNPGPAFVKCALAKMSDEMKLEFKAMLRLPTKYDDAEAEISDMTRGILREAESEDCAGPESQNFRKKVEYIRTKEGDFIRREIPGNRTGCLQPKECSYEPWNRNTETRCTEDAVHGRTHFCAQCKQGFCNPITQFSRCYHPSVSATYCSSANGLYDNRSQQCTLPTRTTEATCLTGAQCRSGTSEPWRCDRTVCVNNNINVVSSCTGSYRWDWGINKCILRDTVFMNNPANCNGAGLVFAPALRFDSGRFETSASCPSRTCDNFQVIMKGGNETDCRSQGYCTSPCSRCRSNSYDNGACRNTTVSALDDCNLIGGKWIAQGTANACVIQREQNTCSGSQLQWIDCNALTSSTCTTSPFSQVLGCQWSQWDSCKSPQTCQAAGFCDDWEFGNSRGEGVCIYEPKEPFRCDGAPATRGGWCIDRQVMNQGGCASPKVWKVRAKTQSECESTTFCQLENGHRTLMGPTTCRECGGKVRAVYTWNVPRWVYGNMVNTTWERIEWRSKNQWIKVLDFDKLQNMLNQAAARLMARTLLNRFAERYSIYATIFQFAACDCISGRTDCFGSGPILSRLKECRADPANAGSCGGLTIPPGTFPNGTAVAINVNLVSAASFVGSRPGNSRSIQRNAVAASVYEVVRNGDDQVIGQLVGNGRQFTFDVTPIANVSLCLDVDPSITQDTAKYSNLDFAPSVNGVLGVPLGRSVSLQGTQYCGSVLPFTSGTFVPILRNNATLIQRAIASSAVASSTAAVPGSSSSGAASPTLTTRAPSAAIKDNYPSFLITLLSLFALL